MFYKLFNFSNSELYYFENKSDSTANYSNNFGDKLDFTNSNNPSSDGWLNNRKENFEKRLCHLIYNLSDHLAKLKNTTKNFSSSFLATNDDTNLNNDHEGKTLLHLCAEAGLNRIFDCLKTLLVSFEAEEMCLYTYIIDELKLIKLDHYGYTPMMLACKYGNEYIACELFKLHLAEFKKIKLLPISFQLLTQHLGIFTLLNR